MTSTQARAPRTIAGIGRVLLWSGGSLWIGRAAGRGEPHAHHAIQLSLGLTGPVCLRAGTAEWRPYGCAFVPSHCAHQFDGMNESVAQIFVEPETLRGRILTEKYAGAGVQALPHEALRPHCAELLAAFRSGAPDADLVQAAQDLLDRLCGDVREVRKTDARITRAIAFVRARLGEPIALADAAGAAHLSQSRFRHLFVLQTGISFRQYLLWARVEAAVGAAMRGASWTAAAHAWGFSDAAHLTRTCRRMFGVAPTMIVPEPVGAERNDA